MILILIITYKQKNRKISIFQRFIFSYWNIKSR